MHRISLIPGDGIGKEVSEAMKKVVLSTGVEIEFEELLAGERAIEKYNTPLPEEVFKSIERNKVAIKGPLTTPIGSGYRSCNLEIRRRLGLFANLRPIKSFKGIEGRYRDVDLVIIRENTEGLYSGIEYKIGKDIAQSIKLITREASENIVDFACKYTKDNGYKKLSCVHKANIMKLSDGLFLEVFRERSKDEDFEKTELIVDAAAMNLVLNPENFEVMVMPNLYGDILSDLGAGLVGGLGIIPSANIGRDVAVFEAVHGSAPEIAGKNLANPTALIQSAVMMLRYLGEEEPARKIEKALSEVFIEGRVLTVDLGGRASTEEFTEEVVNKILKN